MAGARSRLAVEIGGTFTDVIFLEDSGQVRTLKVPSTPRAPEQAMLTGVDTLGLDGGTVGEVLHGSTVATNAVLERRGPVTGFLVTEGFRDLLEIQRGDKENIYDLFYQRTPPLVPRDRVLPIRGRMLHDGNVLVPLDEEQVREAALRLRDMGVRAVAICFLHSYANPAHELRAREIVEEVMPDALVLASAEILPQFREYERASTTVMSAYISPIMVRYIETLRAGLERRRFDGRILITQSNGGIIPVSAIRREVVRTLLSGPAAGVTGAVFVARQAGIDDIITLDMGGTSTDVCLVSGGKPLITTENQLDRLPIAVPMIDIVSVGAGGGSVAWLDQGGMLRVGPRSAGADPGPACYGRGGTEPTVTDSQVYRGLIRPDHFVGGTYRLDVAACRRSIATLAEQTGMTPDQAADAINHIVEANMIQAVRVVSTQRGHDPRHYTMVAFGGAGPIHAVRMAAELGMEQVLVPRHAGLLSAFGLLVADIIRDYVQTRVSVASQTGPEVVAAEIARLQERAVAELAGYGFTPAQIQFYASCDVRYQGQAFELEVPLPLPLPSPAEIGQRFHDLHKSRYGYHSPGQPVEIVNYRVQAVVPRRDQLLDQLSFAPTPGTDVVAVEAPAIIDGRRQSCRFLERSTLPVGYTVSGPAVVEEETSTCYIPPGWRGEVLWNGSLLIAREGQA